MERPVVAGAMSPPPHPQIPVKATEAEIIKYMVVGGGGGGGNRLILPHEKITNAEPVLPDRI